MLKPREIIMNFYLPSQEAKNDTKLGPSLGQYNVKANDLCKRFNEYCIQENLKSGLLYNVTIHIKKDRSFVFKLKTPPLFFLLDKVSYFENLEDPEHPENLKKFINIRDLYKIILIKSKDIQNFDLKLLYKNILYSILKAGNYNIVL